MTRLSLVFGIICACLAVAISRFHAAAEAVCSAAIAVFDLAFPPASAPRELVSLEAAPATLGRPQVIAFRAHVLSRAQRHRGRWAQSALPIAA